MLDIVIRHADLRDLENIISLFEKFRSDWSPARDLAHIVEKYPAVVAYHEDALMGFAYCRRFAPEILELDNIYVENGFRSNNLGTEILQKLEEAIKDTEYKGLILSNSDAFEAKQLKYSASNFYLRNGYRVLVGTDMTRVFYKDL